MFWIAGFLTGVVASVGAAFFFRAIAFVSFRKWRGTLINLLSSVGLLVLALLLLVGIALVLGPGRLSQESAPVDRARVLAESLSEMINCGAWVLLFGLPAGLVHAVLLFRSLQRAVPSGGTSRTGN